jgi:hypothetical protein
MKKTTFQGEDLAKTGLDGFDFSDFPTFSDVRMDCSIAFLSSS